MNVCLVCVCVQDVCSQIWATLYDYPCLQSCEGLVKYIKNSVRLAWSLVNQVSSTVVAQCDPDRFPDWMP